MRFYVASDIHNEFSVFNFPRLENESEMTLVLAGDIFVVNKPAKGLTFLRDVTNRFKNVVMIMGNHEYYGGGSLIRTPEKIKELVKEFSNLYFLENETVTIDGVKFIGATLWTDYHGGDPCATLAARDGLNDFKQFRTGTVAEPYMKWLSVHDIISENNNSRKFISKELKEAKEIGQKCVVVTHHAPHVMSRSEEFRPSVLDYAYFNTGLDDLILDFGPAFWGHGHSHAKADYMIGDTRVICNPRGYSDYSDEYQNAGLTFDPTFIFEL